MAASILCRTLISFFSTTNSSLLPKSHFSVSFYFSTSNTTKPPLDHHTVAKFLINDHRFSPAAAAQIASRTRLRTQQNADSILQFLKHAGFSNPQLERILRSSPKLLSAHLEANIKPKFEILRDFGFTPAEIAEIVSNQSRLLYHSAPRISSSIDATGLFLRDIDATLLPNVEFLKSCGVSTELLSSGGRRTPRTRKSTDASLLLSSNIRERWESRVAFARFSRKNICFPLRILCLSSSAFVEYLQRMSNLVSKQRK